MKNINWVFVAFLFALLFSARNHAYASYPVEPIKINPGAEVWKNLKARDFVKLSTKEFRSITGQRMSLREKISFKLLKSNIKHQLKTNPDITVYESMVANKKMGVGWWILIGVAVILIVGLIIFAIEGFDFNPWQEI
ncbi:MAG TPA: hypothetical protein VLR49_01395 [Ferruginibacter sp.]|nr:hypothetical protein [Ferruginibacter sp.]